MNEEKGFRWGGPEKKERKLGWRGEKSIGKTKKDESFK